MKITVTLSKKELAQIGGNKHQLESHIWKQVDSKPVDPSDKVDLKKVDYDVEVVLTN